MKLVALLSTAAALSPSKLDRRNALKFGAAGLATSLAPPALAAAPATVFVAGATGQTGRRVLERLAAKGGSVVAGVVLAPFAPVTGRVAGAGFPCADLAAGRCDMSAGLFAVVALVWKRSSVTTMGHGAAVARICEARDLQA